MPKIILEIDSEQRNKTIFPSSSDFVYRLKGVKQGVTEILLKCASIYNASYAVNNYNQSFVFTVGATPYSISITKGNYTSDTLATEIQARLNAAGSTVTFVVTVNDSQSKFTIAGNGAFVLNFSSSPLCARLLGFSAINTTASTSVISDKCFNISNTPYYYLSIPEVRTMNEARAQQCFTVIHNNVNTGSLLLWKPKDMPQSLGAGMTIDILTLRLYDSNANLVDLNGFEVYYEIELTY
jgi:hypothetical protein